VATLHEETYFIGNRKLMEEHNIGISNYLAELVAGLQSEAKTVVYFANGNHTLAVIAIADKIKLTSAAAIKALQEKVLRYTCSRETTNKPRKQ